MLLCGLLEEQASSKGSAGEAEKIRMRERRKGGRGEGGRKKGGRESRRVTTRRGHSHEVQGRKRAELLERTQVTKATATMSRNLGYV